MLGIENGVVKKCRTWLKNVVNQIKDGGFSLVLISGYTNPENLVDESPDEFINNTNKLHPALTVNEQRAGILKGVWGSETSPILHRYTHEI